MEKLKKVWKELSVFGIVIVVFLGLFIYRKTAFGEYHIINETKLADKLEAKDSFVVVVGNSSQNATISYQSVMQEFVNKNHNKDFYFVDLKDNKDITKFFKEKLNTDETTLPQTFIIKNGEVKIQKSGALTFYRLTDLYNKK